MKKLSSYNIETEESLIKVLEGFNIMPGDAIKILSKFKPVFLKKNEFFTKQGSKCNYIGILLEGLLCAFPNYEDYTSKIVSRFYYPCKNFSAKGNFIISGQVGFNNSIPSEENIIALEDSLLACITLNDMESLHKEISQLNYITRVVFEHAYNKAIQRINLLQVLPKKERVGLLYEQQPILFKIAKIQDIASYLSVNRNTISLYLKKCKKSHQDAILQ